MNIKKKDVILNYYRSLRSAADSIRFRKRYWQIHGRIHSQENTGVDIESGRYRGGYKAKKIQGCIKSLADTGAETEPRKYRSG